MKEVGIHVKYFFQQYNFIQREPNCCQEVQCTSRPSGVGLAGYTAAYFLLLAGGSAERSGVLRSLMEVQYARRPYTSALRNWDEVACFEDSGNP
jgi:hypothetical protein